MSGTGGSGGPGRGPGSGARPESQRLRTTRGRSVSQQRWLTRQLNDPYVALARKAGWRSRAAFKLIELDDRYKLLTPGCRVLDLGAAPGGWSQVAMKRGAGRIVAIDLLKIEPIAGVDFIHGDLAADGMDRTIVDRLGGRADLVLSDMAPNTTGHASTDHIRIIALAELALDLALETLAENGSFVAKVFQGGSERQMLDPLKRAFRTVRHVKPPASRKESSELYVVATGFRAGKD